MENKQSTQIIETKLVLTYLLMLVGALSFGSVRSKELKEESIHTLENEIVAFQIGEVSSGAESADAKDIRDVFGFTLGEDDSEVFYEFGGGDGEKDSFFKFRLSLPVDDSDPRLELGELNNLRDKSRFEVNWQKRFFGKPDLAESFGRTNETLSYNQRASTLVESLAATGADEAYWLFGVKGVLAHKRFSFFESADSSETMTENATDYSIAAYLGRQRNNKEYFGASITHVDSSQGSDNKNICAPIPDSSSFTCLDKVVGSPESMKSTLGSLIYSRRIKSLGYQIKVTRDFDLDVTGVSLPFWFRRTEEGVLNAGVQLDWNSEDKDVVASLFFNTPFEFPKF